MVAIGYMLYYYYTQLVEKYRGTNTHFYKYLYLKKKNKLLVLWFAFLGIIMLTYFSC